LVLLALSLYQEFVQANIPQKPPSTPYKQFCPKPVPTQSPTTSNAFIGLVGAVK